MRVTRCGKHRYFHCQICDRGYYTVESARSCCAEERRVRTYNNRQTEQRMQKRFSIILDMSAL
jgi:hypothetical protein